MSCNCAHAKSASFCSHQNLNFNSYFVYTRHWQMCERIDCQRRLKIQILLVLYQVYKVSLSHGHLMARLHLLIRLSSLVVMVHCCLLVILKLAPNTLIFTCGTSKCVIRAFINVLVIHQILLKLIQSTT